MRKLRTRLNNRRFESRKSLNRRRFEDYSDDTNTSSALDFGDSIKLVEWLNFGDLEEEEAVDTDFDILEETEYYIDKLDKINSSRGKKYYVACDTRGRINLNTGDDFIGTSASAFSLDHDISLEEFVDLGYACEVKVYNILGNNSGIHLFVVIDYHVPQRNVVLTDFDINNSRKVELICSAGNKYADRALSNTATEEDIAKKVLQKFAKKVLDF